MKKRKRKKNNYPTKIKLFTKPINLELNDVKVLYEKIIEKRMLNDNQVVIQDFTKSLEINANIQGAYLAIYNLAKEGKAEHFSSFLEEINETFHSYYDNDSDNIKSARFYIGYWLQKKIIEYSEVIELVPTDAKAYFLRALAHIKYPYDDLKNYAISDLTHAISIQPDFCRGFITHSIADLTKAIELDPKLTFCLL